MQPILLAALVVVLVVNLVVVRFLVPPPFTAVKGYLPPAYKRLESVVVVDGVVPFSSSMAIKRSTYNPIASDYVYLPANSDPIRGGFTYSFWMRVKLRTHLMIPGEAVPILLRGSENTVTYGTDNFVTIAQGPKISLRVDDKREIFVQVNANTVHNPNFEHQFRSSELRKLTAVDWVMLTFVFKENRMKIGSTHTSSGFQIDMYMNHRLAGTVDAINDALIPSPGDLIILPNVTIADGVTSHMRLAHFEGFLADVRYHNYAMSGVDVDRLYAAGFRRTPFQPIKAQDTARRAREYGVVAMENEIRMLHDR